LPIASSINKKTYGDGMVNIVFNEY